ncbi:centromere protein T [Xyrichtys novacula]|uniref:Centromere protein T n=1 Tax=Xyrichtys novacula TaxID=13765 RepID=A0AAV1H5Y1_XYRNO|nr:centromere protein T [Xyrichtys novacula]
MDHTEDLSARVLLKHILTTEPPRTPVTRSASAALGSISPTRRSSRLRNKEAGAKTPQDILRRSLKHKIHDSVTRKSLPAPKRRTTSAILKRTPAPASMLFDDGDTPRHILMNILRTEPVRSPVIHEKTPSEEPQPFSANSSISNRRPSTELSGLDLPDLTIRGAVSTAKGLSRKRPRRSLNVTAFEKRLRDNDDGEFKFTIIDAYTSDFNSTSLSLKTPFMDAHTERRGLQRRVSHRRKITEEEFGAAVNKRHLGEVTSFLQPKQGLSETAHSEGFTLGLSKLGEPDLTTDIIHCSTALYAQPDAMTSNFSVHTGTETQLQEQISEIKQSKLRVEKSSCVFPTEEEAEPQEEQRFSESQEDSDRGDIAESDKQENLVAAHTEEKEVVDYGTEEENQGVGVDSEPEEDAASRSQSDGEEVIQDTPAEKGDGEEDSQTEEEREGVVDSQNDEEEDAADSQTGGEEGADSQDGEEDAVETQSEEEEIPPDSHSQREDEAVYSQTEEDNVPDSLPVEEEEEDLADDASDPGDPAEGGSLESKHEDEHNEEQEEEDVEQAPVHLEHISRRAHLSEGGLVQIAEAELSDGKSKASTKADLQYSLDTGSQEFGETSVRYPELAETPSEQQKEASGNEDEPDADQENSFHPPEVLESNEQLGEESPEKAAAQEEEEWEDEEDEEDTEDIPSKTPAFVKEKRNLFQPDPLASPVLKNTQASASDGEGLAAPKPKQARKRGKRSARKEGSLPKSYLMGIFKHFAKTKVAADVYPILQEIMDKFFERMAEDLETYALHAKRKTIEVEDTELLLRRQGHVNDKVPVEVLIEKYLRMDQRRLLIPIATSGNVVFPKKRR